MHMLYNYKDHEITYRLMQHGYMYKKTVLDSGFQAVNSTL